jgi:hypothetical protein
VLAFLGVKTGEEKNPGKKQQAIGEYCNKKDIEECRKYFGEELARVCMNCPE